MIGIWIPVGLSPPPWSLESGPLELGSCTLDVGIWTPGGCHLDPWKLESGPLEVGIRTLEVAIWTPEVGIWNPEPITTQIRTYKKTITNQTRK